MGKIEKCVETCRDLIRRHYWQEVIMAEIREVTVAAERIGGI